VPDRGSAYRLLRTLDSKLPATEARALLDQMEGGTPLPVMRQGWRPDEHLHVRGWTELGVEFMYFRQIVWPCYDICPDCNGTANRGLPEGHPKEWAPVTPEAPVELQMHERDIDGERQPMTREELERLFKVFSRGESYDGQVPV
jgi:hypothetical protein